MPSIILGKSAHKTFEHLESYIAQDRVSFYEAAIHHFFLEHYLRQLTPEDGNSVRRNTAIGVPFSNNLVLSWAIMQTVQSNGTWILHTPGLFTFGM